MPGHDFALIAIAAKPLQGCAGEGAVMPAQLEATKRHDAEEIIGRAEEATPNEGVDQSPV
jgi:hypothetical protein